MTTTWYSLVMMGVLALSSAQTTPAPNRPGDRCCEDSTVQETPKVPIFAALDQFCSKRTNKYLCKGRQDIGLFGTLLSRKLEGDADWGKADFSACGTLVSGKNLVHCAGFKKVKQLYKSFETQLKSAGVKFENVFSEDIFTIFDSANFEVFKQGLNMISDNEAVSVLQLTFSMFAHILEIQAQTRMVQVRLKKLQEDGYVFGVLGLAATFIIFASYLGFAAFMGYKKFKKDRLKVQQKAAKTELKRFRDLMSLHRLEEEALSIE